MPSPKVSPEGPDYDAVVLGAGVVGLACAAALAPKRRVLVVDRARTFGTETSSRNSQVIHAGMYYPTGSWKARLCVRGNASLYAYCRARGIAHANVGKLIVATSSAEEAKLHELRARGIENGTQGLGLLSGAEVARRAPGVRATAALFSPATGIVDGHGVMASLMAEAREHGADVAFRHRVTAAEPAGRGYRLRLEDERGEVSSLYTTCVVNAAGLEADRVAALVGIDADAAGYTLRFVKGTYFRLRRRGLLPHLVYPIPLAHLAGLGIHVTLELDGAVRLGPDVEPLPERVYDYAVDEGKRRAFFEAVRSYLDGLHEDDLVADSAGLRPKLARFEGPSPDFRIVEESARGLPGWVNLVGIESPGLTCALELGREVRALLP